MMVIAFRHVPFDQAQRAALDEIAHEAGYETLWLDGSVPTKEDLAGCEVLMGYFPVDVLGQLPDLKWLQLPAAGVERFCTPGVFYSEDVILTNSSGVFGIDISEYMICAILMMMRHMRGYVKAMDAAEWANFGPARSIYGSTATVIGTGNIGCNVAQRLKALGAVSVRGINDDGSRPSDDFDATFRPDGFAEALDGADIVVACLPDTPSTRGMISADYIKAMGERTIFVNAGRGTTVDQKALTEALSSHALYGAVLDVMTPEPLPADDPLWQLDNVIITPHIAGWDDDEVNISLMFELFADNLRRWTSGKPLTHVIDRTRGF